MGVLLPSPWFLSFPTSFPPSPVHETGEGGGGIPTWEGGGTPFSPPPQRILGYSPPLPPPSWDRTPPPLSSTHRDREREGERGGGRGVPLQPLSPGSLPSPPSPWQRGREGGARTSRDNLYPSTWRSTGSTAMAGRTAIALLMGTMAWKRVGGDPYDRPGPCRSTRDSLRTQTQRWWEAKRRQGRRRDETREVMEN